jgi:putative flippase GtrA
MMTPAYFAAGYREAHLAAAPASVELHERYALAPFDAGGSLTLQSPPTTSSHSRWTDERGLVRSVRPYVGPQAIRARDSTQGELGSAHPVLSNRRVRLFGQRGAIRGMRAGIGLAPYVAAVVAFAGAVCNNFLWNRRWTFPRRGPGARHEAIRFFVVSSIAFGVSLSMLTALVAVARLPAISAQVISIAVAMPVSFAGNKLWTFRQDSSRDSPGNSATPRPGPPQVISADKEVSI